MVFLYSLWSQESKLLVTNLGSEQLRQWSIVTNPERLRLLAILHESLDWFSSKLKEMVPPPDLPQENQSGGSVPVVRVTMETENRYLSLREVCACVCTCVYSVCVMCV